MTLRASYILDNRLPDNMKLFSFNNSTNPWLRIEGNPYLKPEILHKMSVSLGKSWNRVYLRGYVDHYRYAKMIERYMRQEGDVTILSYRNNGTYRATEAGLMLNLRFGKFACNTNAAYTTERYSGQHDNGSIYLRGIFQWTFGKFLLHSVLEWRNKYYNAVSFTKYSNPTEAMLMLSWKATKTLQVAVGMPYFGEYARRPPSQTVGLPWGELHQLQKREPQTMDSDLLDSPQKFRTVNTKQDAGVIKSQPVRTEPSMESRTSPACATPVRAQYFKPRKNHKTTF